MITGTRTRITYIILVCYKLNFQNLFSPQTRENENRKKDHLHNIGLLQAVPRFLVLPPGMLANANNPGNAKYICCSFLSTLDFLLLFLLFIKIQMKLFQPQCSKLFLVFAESQRRKKLGTFRPLQPLYRSPAQSLSSNWIGPTYKNVVNPGKRKSIC